MKKTCFSWLLCVTAAAMLAGCASNPAQPGDSSAAPSKEAAKPTPKWMNARGEVIDASEAESGYGTEVKGLDDWEGEITGKPAPKSKFTKLKIGMPMHQVVNLLGQPDDQGAYITGKAWIPFYFGTDRNRFELVYKGQGRLIFAGGHYGQFTSGNLIWIIHSANQGPSR